jgi:hypothetical protein
MAKKKTVIEQIEAWRKVIEPRSDQHKKCDCFEKQGFLCKECGSKK